MHLHCSLRMSDKMRIYFLSCTLKHFAIISSSFSLCFSNAHVQSFSIYFPVFFDSKLWFFWFFSVKCFCTVSRSIYINKLSHMGIVQWKSFSSFPISEKKQLPRFSIDIYVHNVNIALLNFFFSFFPDINLNVMNWNLNEIHWWELICSKMD